MSEGQARLPRDTDTDAPVRSRPSPGPDSPDAPRVPEPDLGLAGAAVASASRGAPVTPAAAVQLQRSVGNRATTLVLGGAMVQRGPGPGGSQPQPAGAWRMPFELGLAGTNEAAVSGLITIMDRFRDLKKLTDLPDVQAACDSVVASLGGEADRVGGQDGAAAITEHDLADLDVMGTLAAASYQERLEELAEKAVEALERIQPESTDGAQDELAEEMHARFLAGDAEGIEAVKEGLEGIKSYTEKATKAAQWANRAKGVWQLVADGADGEEAWRAPEEIAELLKGKSELSEGLEHVNQVLSAAQLIADISAIGHDRADSIDRTVDEFHAAMSAVNLGLSVFKVVPIFGQLWSSYYMPLTDACLKGVQVLARYADQENRQLAWASIELDKAYGAIPKADGVPQIPEEYLSHFPGGQPVFDYVYRLVNDMGPRMTDAAQEYFLGNHELLQAGEHEEIETEGGSHWYEPWTWGERETSPNLVSWLAGHRDHVWSSLYGNLPQRW